MSVFKEAFEAVGILQSNSVPVFNDACDYGAPVIKGGKVWNAIQTLRAYFNPEWSKQDLTNQNSRWFEVDITDEWAVSDGRKTWYDATTTFRIHFERIKGVWDKKPSLNSMFKDDKVVGFVSIDVV